MTHYRLTRRRTTALLISILLLLIGYAQQAGWLGKASEQATNNSPGFYQVTQSVDGDTIAIDMNGKTEKIRFIGVDTPETHKPNTPVQCYGPAASAFTKNILASQGNKVRLESDQLSTNRDRYDRLLRYIYLPDGTLLNLRLIQEGYGFYYPYFPFTKSAQFDAAQQTAKTANKGVWGNCNPTQTDKGGWLSNNQ